MSKKKKVTIMFLLILLAFLSVSTYSFYKLFTPITIPISTYQSDTLDITLEYFREYEPNLEYWIATVNIKDIAQLKSAFAYDDFEGTKKQFISTMARKNNAVLAINGSATGFNELGIVIRDGIIYRDLTFDSAPLEIRNDGTLFIGKYGTRRADQILAEGAVHTYDYSPELIIDGKMAPYTNSSWFHTDKQPRTAIGQSTPYEYIIIIADGRSKRSEGMSYMQLTELFASRDCKWAYALDGGGSTTLFFNNRVINRPSNIIERPYSDILYFID